MDTKFWNIFRRSSNQLQGQPYESVEEGRLPFRGTYPVKGNGPSMLELYRQGKTSVNPPRQLIDDKDNKLPFSPRPGSAPDKHETTAPEPAVTTKAAQRLKAGLTRSRKSTPELSKFVKKRTSSIGLGNTLYNYNNFDGGEMSEVSPRAPASAEGKRHRRKSTHVALLDAVPTPDAVREKSNGRRDYGEDVADRNLANYREATAISPLRNDASLAHSVVQQNQDADWYNQAFVKDGSKPWEQAHCEALEVFSPSEGTKVM